MWMFLYFIGTAKKPANAWCWVLYKSVTFLNRSWIITASVASFYVLECIRAASLNSDKLTFCV